MTITRRTGLAAIIGGIFGAKPMAQQAAKQITGYGDGGKLNPAWVNKEYNIMDVAKDNIDPVAALAKRTEHIRQLTEQAAGKFLPHQQEDLDRYNKRPQFKIRLKSISKDYKTIMEQEMHKERTKKIWMEEAKQQLLRAFGINLP